MAPSSPEPSAHSDETPHRRRGEETAELILDAAEECFARKGYAGTTLRAVADSVGIRIPSLYNHFESKESLYQAVLERGMSPILEVLSGSVGTDGESSSEPTYLIREIMTLLGQRPNLPRLIQYELLAGGDHLAPILENWLRPAITRSLEMLQTTPGIQGWKSDQHPYLLLTFFNIVVGHFTTTALTGNLTGSDPLSQTSIAESSAFYSRIFTTIIQGAKAPNESAN